MAETDLRKMTVAELEAFAAEHSVDLSDADLKADKIAAIEAAGVLADPGPGTPSEQADNPAYYDSAGRFIGDSTPTPPEAVPDGYVDSQGRWVGDPTPGPTE